MLLIPVIIIMDVIKTFCISYLRNKKQLKERISEPSQIELAITPSPPNQSDNAPKG